MPLPPSLRIVCSSDLASITLLNGTWVLDDGSDQSEQMFMHYTAIGGVHGDILFRLNQKTLNINLAQYDQSTTWITVFFQPNDASGLLKFTCNRGAIGDVLVIANIPVNSPPMVRTNPGNYEYVLPLTKDGEKAAQEYENAKRAEWEKRLKPPHGS